MAILDFFQICAVTFLREQILAEWWSPSQYYWLCCGTQHRSCCLKSSSPLKRPHKWQISLNYTVRKYSWEIQGKQTQKTFMSWSQAAFFSGYLQTETVIWCFGSDGSRSRECIWIYIQPYSYFSNQPILWRRLIIIKFQIALESISASCWAEQTLGIIIVSAYICTYK